MISLHTKVSKTMKKTHPLVLQACHYLWTPPPQSPQALTALPLHPTQTFKCLFPFSFFPTKVLIQRKIENNIVSKVTARGKNSTESTKSDFMISTEKKWEKSFFLLILPFVYSEWVFFFGNDLKRPQDTCMAAEVVAWMKNSFDIRFIDKMCEWKS